VGDGRALIEVRNLSHRYPAGALALDGVSFTVRAGEFIAIIGQNGAGKTTLTKHLNGLLKPTAGIVVVEGRDTRRLRTALLARTVGYVFQNPDHQIFSESVWEEVAFGPRSLGLRGAALEAAVDGALRDVELLDLRSRHPYTLSKGDRQRVALASTLAMGQPIIVVDEPTTGQDYHQSRQIMDLLRAQHQVGRTVLVVTHDMTVVAEYTERTLVMGRGKLLADGPTREMFSDFDLLRGTHLQPPQITELGVTMGAPCTILTVAEMRDHLVGARGATLAARWDER
jgi:energy-coupling factor transporter ATP-binding protein EcfA2